MRCVLYRCATTAALFLLQGCSIEPEPRVLEARMSCGLVRGHAYSITKVLKADIQTPRVKGDLIIYQ